MYRYLNTKLNFLKKIIKHDANVSITLITETLKKKAKCEKQPAGRLRFVQMCF